MSAANLMRTNHGNAVDYRPAGPRERVAPCPIPDWVRILGRRAFNGLPTSERNLAQLIASAAYVASLEQSSFGRDKEQDAKIKDAVKLHHSTWILPPLIRALEMLLNQKGDERL